MRIRWYGIYRGDNGDADRCTRILPMRSSALGGILALQETAGFA
jgi:hypothetical protein